MKLFVNDIPVKIKRMDKEFLQEDFTFVVKGEKIKELSPSQFVGRMLIWDSSREQIDRLFKIMKDKKLKKLESVTFAVDDKESVVHFIKDQFKVIKAAGGVVVKEGKVLFIYRLNKWDLPKGKLEKKETAQEGALREVEEECSVKVQLDKKVGSTWHTYIQNDKRILKKTIWYKMQCLDDTKMKPQYEEGIHDIKWLDENQVKEALTNSYRSIQDVIRKYLVLEDELKNSEVKAKSF